MQKAMQNLPAYAVPRISTRLSDVTRLAHCLSACARVKDVFAQAKAAGLHWVCCISQDATRTNNTTIKAGHTLRAAGEGGGGGLSVSASHTAPLPPPFPSIWLQTGRNAEAETHGRTGAIAARPLEPPRSVRGVAVSSDPLSPWFWQICTFRTARRGWPEPCFRSYTQTHRW